MLTIRRRTEEVLIAASEAHERILRGTYGSKEFLSQLLRHWEECAPFMANALRSFALGMLASAEYSPLKKRLRKQRTKLPYLSQEVNGIAHDKGRRASSSRRWLPRGTLNGLGPDKHIGAPYAPKEVLRSVRRLWRIPLAVNRDSSDSNETSWEIHAATACADDCLCGQLTVLEHAILLFRRPAIPGSVFHAVGGALHRKKTLFVHGGKTKDNASARAALLPDRGNTRT